MITTSNRVFTVKVYDTTVEKKTTGNLLIMMTEVLDILKHEWGVTPIAFTTDASGESRKAQRLLRSERDNLVTPDCYAHQINLIVGDYFKTNGIAFLRYASEANDLITWLRSKTCPYWTNQSRTCVPWPKCPFRHSACSNPLDSLLPCIPPSP
ncbi:hypothetical protein EDB92DRAFT_845925 [Lactarius akahatsu]|uniref:DUF659 domain-containing protein n=1 Tax=Lactarius akahatsu TaxID=416441 RepID=A0AAD4L7Z2_9AGAM|nr:hypothetical protein EDB92DRAFT_845925 [Lactarius akahatsu]